MQPIEAYKHTSDRAARLLRMHDALVNTRKYGIRADWAAKFRQLMHWSGNAEIERVDSRQAVIILRHRATVTPADFTSDAAGDLLRSALVLSVSALDRYVHERVVKGIVTALKASDLNRSQEQLQLPAAVTIRITQRVRRANLAGEAVRPANEVRKEVQELLHKRPFQSWREVEYGFELLGVKNFAGQVQAAYGTGDIRPIQTQLAAIAKRRNQIVHEGDLVRHQRGGQCRCHEITPKFVRDSIAFLDTFVGHLEAVE